jgi:hypothetical protein
MRVKEPSRKGTGSTSPDFVNLYLLPLNLLCWLSPHTGIHRTIGRAKPVRHWTFCPSGRFRHMRSDQKRTCPPALLTIPDNREVMKMNSNHTRKHDPCPVMNHARAMSGSDEHTSPQQMPAGGWLREVSSRENWRTTTIVHRHRDQAASTTSP